MIGVGPKTLLPAASCAWTVTSQVDPGTACVVGVPAQVFPVMASFAAGPALVTESDAEPGVSPATAAVTVQLPGAPVVVTVELAVLAPAGMVCEVGLTLQTAVLSTLNVTVFDWLNDATAPLESRRVAVTLVDCGPPAGNSDWPSVAVTAVGAPAWVKATLVRQPWRLPAAAES